jgi:hypothetical protein
VVDGDCFAVLPGGVVPIGVGLVMKKEQEPTTCYKNRNAGYGNPPGQPRLRIHPLKKRMPLPPQVKGMQPPAKVSQNPCPNNRITRRPEHRPNPGEAGRRRKFRKSPTLPFVYGSEAGYWERPAPKAHLTFGWQ